jgi:hypothetical protein
MINHEQELRRLTKQRDTLISTLKQIVLTFEQLQMNNRVERLRLIILANEK